MATPVQNHLEAVHIAKRIGIGLVGVCGDLGVCVAIAKRSVEEYKQGKWIKAVQSFFGKSEDAPWKSYYQAHITNQEVSNASND